MKYKRIDAALHNFGHSFMSDMNYVDGKYVVEVLASELRKLSIPRLEICFPSGRILPRRLRYPRSLRKSVSNYSQRLSRHLTDAGVDPQVLQEVRLVVYGDRYGIGCKVRAKDDRGNDHDVEVRGTA